MEKLKISKLLSLIVMLAGLIVTAGWIFDIAVLKSISPNWISMKITTAVCFFFSGVTLYFIAEAQKENPVFSQMVLSSTILIILLFMGTSLISWVLGMNLGIENLFMEDVSDPSPHWVPGRPSLLTTFAFALVSVAGVLSMLDVAKLKTKLLYIGWVVLVIGGIAVLGYTFSIPFLFYDIQGWSNPMAVHTSILFIISGASLILLTARD